MRIIEKIKAKQENNWDYGGITIGFLGDSVTQGCFELYLNNHGGIETCYDQKNAYHSYVSRILSMLYPSVPINIINAGIGGGNASHGAARIEKDLLVHHPDLCVVCFGLNDAMNGMEGIANYTKGLSDIFIELKRAEIETIFMTPNMMNTEISVHLKEEAACNVAKDTLNVQTKGIMDAYMNAAIDVCQKNGVAVCDCYKKWKIMEGCGVDISNLLANHINHPIKELHWLFAVSLVETMFKM